ncbi:uncharacterized protein I206_103424 [Kwoniella pini CBS 10737]|uniref:Cytidyltransferase-like domain-containing protein n=1 Tax=Kwoniella pini CBS 10737 TaxID=1296096 RepID=A0A1B9I9P1_9TREE|nr:uncharacterized protein I206_01572 [Kwoniella pini CBS 10737]OCF52285.1 hypothetical protein I206_01572 [Kwoniella pini CBS 10737]
MTTPSIQLLDHTILLAPFTLDILQDPSNIISIILDVLPKSSLKSFTVIFTSPSSSTTVQEQLYKRLKESPVLNFSIFQSFLGKVYAGLATSQLSIGKILMDVEIHFDGEDGSWNEKIFRSKGEFQLLLIDGISIPFDLIEILSPLSQIKLPFIYPTKSITTLTTLTSILDNEENILPGPNVVALGGTFDHLHAAHKLLLQCSYFLTQKKIIVGIMSDKLLITKKFNNLIENLKIRLNNVKSFLNRFNSENNKIELEIIEILDLFGPTKFEFNMQALIVSKETLSGGKIINNLRKKNGLNELNIFIVDVIFNKNQNQNQNQNQIEEKDEIEIEIDDEMKLKELKMGSTGIRKWISENGQHD